MCLYKNTQGLNQECTPLFSDLYMEINGKLYFIFHQFTIVQHFVLFISMMPFFKKRVRNFSLLSKQGQALLPLQTCSFDCQRCLSL